MYKYSGFLSRHSLAMFKTSNEVNMKKKKRNKNRFTGSKVLMICSMFCKHFNNLYRLSYTLVKGNGERQSKEVWDKSWDSL